MLQTFLNFPATPYRWQTAMRATQSFLRDLLILVVIGCLIASFVALTLYVTQHPSELVRLVGEWISAGQGGAAEVSATSP